MAHELRGLPNLSHEMLTLILGTGLASAALIIGFVLYLGRRHKRRRDPGNAADLPKKSVRQRRKRRR